MIKGDRLRQLRTDRGLSAEALAAELNIGLSQVFRYEAEKTDPSSDVLIKIALYFKVSTDYLVGLARDPAERGRMGESGTREGGSCVSLGERS